MKSGVGDARVMSRNLAQYRKLTDMYPGRNFYTNEMTTVDFPMEIIRASPCLHF